MRVVHIWRVQGAFVKKEGKQGFMKALKASKDLFDYKIGVLSDKFKKNTPRGKSRIASEILPTIARIKDAVLKAGYLKKLSEELSVDEQALKAEINKVRPYDYPESMSASGLYGADETEKISAAESTLLALALEDSKCIERVEKELGFHNLKNKNICSIFATISKKYKDGKEINPSHFMSHLDSRDAEKTICESLAMGQMIKDREKVFQDCLKHIRRSNLKIALEDIQSKIKDAENSGDDSKLIELMREYNGIVKTICG